MRSVWKFQYFYWLITLVHWYSRPQHLRVLLPNSFAWVRHTLTVKSICDLSPYRLSYRVSHPSVKSYPCSYSLSRREWVRRNNCLCDIRQSPANTTDWRNPTGLEPLKAGVMRPNLDSPEFTPHTFFLSEVNVQLTCWYALRYCIAASSSANIHLVWLFRGLNGLFLKYCTVAVSLCHLKSLPGLYSR